MAPTKRPFEFTEVQKEMLKELAERKVIKAVRKKKVQFTEPVPEPEPEEKPKKPKKPKRVKHKYVQKEKNVYPYLGDREAMDDVGLKFAVKDVQKTAARMLDKAGIRCTVPLAQMAVAAKRVRETLENRRVERFGSSLPALEATMDEAFGEFSETTCQMDKSIFRQELLKYQAIAATQLDKLETSTLLSMVADLVRSGSTMVEYEAGGPVKPSTNVNKFFGLTKLQYRCLTDHQKLTLLREHSKYRYRYYREYETHLNGKYTALRAEAEEKKRGKKASQISKSDPFKHWPEGRTREEELQAAFELCRDMQRFIHQEFQRLINKEDDCVTMYHDVWRHMRIKKYLKGKKGPLNEQDEHTLDREFANCPIDVLRGIADRYLEECPTDSEDEKEKEEAKAKDGEAKDKDEETKDTDGEQKKEDKAEMVVIMEQDADWNVQEEVVVGMELEEVDVQDNQGDITDKDGDELAKEGDKAKDGLSGELGEMRLDEVKEGNGKENEGEQEGKKKKKRKDILQLLVRRPRSRSPAEYMAITPAYHRRYDPF